MAKPHKNIVYYLLSLIYGGVTEFRNFLFDTGIVKSVRFPLPVICVGNLAVGGTGKTPHTEFLLRILSGKMKTAVLSRGYKRETSGFFLANKDATARQIGDEPFQIFSKFPQIYVAVDEKRVHGVSELLKQKPETEAIILDDAFQHRHIRPGLNILLTDYNLLFTEDKMLPYGTLRELPKNSSRADIIIVTKCPETANNLNPADYRKRLKMHPRQEIYFSTYVYGDIYPVFDIGNKPTAIKPDTTIFMITGIENPTPMKDYLMKFSDKVIRFSFPDHHVFTADDFHKIESEWNKVLGTKRMITTEKDAARLKSIQEIPEVVKNNIFALPLEVKILNDEENNFNKKIYDYVRKNSTNS